MTERDLTPEEITFIEENYLKAFDIFLKTQPLAKSGSKNFFACVDYLKAENIDPSLWDFHVFLTSLTMIAADGKLDRDLTPQEYAEKERKVNAARHARDRGGRRDGHVEHLKPEEEEALEVEGMQNWAKNLEALKQRIALAAKGPAVVQEATASDCLFALTQGQPELPFTREHVQTWLNKWPADLCRSVRKRQETLRERMDAVLATGVDPMIGINQ